VLAELGRTESHRFRVLEPDSDETKALRAMTRAREGLVRTRSGSPTNCAISSPAFGRELGCGATAEREPAGTRKYVPDRPAPSRGRVLAVAVGQSKATVRI